MRAIFLDRDGVINKYPGDKQYVTSLRKFCFLPRAKKALAQLHKNKFLLFIISNQAGVGKRVYSARTLNLITKRMLEAIEKSAGKIKAVYYCTHRPNEHCRCRKPKAGLIHAAAKLFPLDLKSSFFIGDTILDVRTAKAAGCKSILVLCGKEKLSNSANWQVKPDFVFSDLYQATQFLIKQK